ncbi:MAG: HesA/MoeB/ThiF family protein [bacterium]
MRASLVMTPAQWDTLYQHLHESESEERFAVLLVGHSRSRGAISLLCHKVVPYTDARLVDTSMGIRLSPEGIVHMMNLANTAGTGIVEVHSHVGPSRGVAFSSTDIRGHAEIVPFALPELPNGCCYGSVVTGSESASGMVWETPEDEPVPFEGIQKAGLAQPTNTEHKSPIRVGESRRYTRQVTLLGKVGQKLIEETRVGIVGLGGTGSIVARTLAYEGVRSFVLIDPDVVELSNLNRLDGSRRWDVWFGRKKAKVLRREIRRIAPGSDVVVIPKSLFTKKALSALKRVDVLFGCTDNDATRLCLNELSAGYVKPYIDMGSGIETSEGRTRQAGARLAVVLPGEGCLLDAKAVDLKQVGYELSDPAMQELAREEGYVSGAEVAAPSVMSLNQTIASLAVTEFKALVTHMRPPFRLMYYDLLEGTLHPVDFQKNGDCVVCNDHLGKGDLLSLGKRYAEAD